MAAPYRVPAIHRVLPLFACALLFLASPALAADAMFVTVVNTTGLPAADLHVTFAGTGGNIYVDPYSVYTVGCPVPAVPSNPPTVTAVAVIDWGVECVAPGNAVTFVARTTAGPLVITDVVWTDDTGAVIGPGPWEEDPLPPPEDPFAAIKFHTQYFGGEKTYTWFRVNEDQFFRICCRAKRWSITTIYFCPVISRFGGLFETGPWTKLGEIRNKLGKPSWSFQWEWVWFWGLRLEDCIPPVPNHAMPLGPPPSGSGNPNFKQYDRMDFGLDVRYSETSGQTWRQGTDFTSAFQAVAESLVTYVGYLPSQTPLLTLSEILTDTGEKYSAASSVLGPLITEVDDTRIAEPNPLLDDIYQDLLDLQAATGDVGTHLQTGTATDPVPFQNLSQSLNALAADIGNVTSSPRFDNAAAQLSLAAAGAFDASNLLYAGLNDTIAAAQFGSIMNGSIPDQLRAFGNAMWPHISIEAKICDYVWNRSTIDAAWVVVTNLDTLEPPDSFAVEISNEGTFFIPTMDIQEGTRLHVRYKLPTFLSVEFDVDWYTDGMHFGPTSLVGGDANGDDCISLADLAMVAGQSGQGGWNWETSVSTADVTGDGVVNSVDVSVVQYNYLKCGPITTGVTPARPPSLVTLEAFPNPTDGIATVRFELPQEAAVTIRLYNVRGQEVAVVANERYPAGSNQVELRGTKLPGGVYLCRLTASVPGATPVQRVAKMTILR
jgi:hypothetical protein